MIGSILKLIYDEKTKALEAKNEFYLAKKQSELQKKNLSIMEKALKQKAYQQKMNQIQEEIDEYDDEEIEEDEESLYDASNPDAIFGNIINKVANNFIKNIPAQTHTNTHNTEIPELTPQAVTFIKNHSFEEVLPYARKIYPNARDDVIKNMYEAIH